MTINKNKSNRIKFGHFSSESEAQAELARREKSLPKNLTGDFRVLKLQNKKSGKRNWMGIRSRKKIGGVAQSAEATDLKSVKCGFESRLPYQTTF